MDVPDEDAPLLGDRAASVSRPAAAVQRSTTLCILGNELCERVAYFAIATNLVVYFTDELGYTNSEADVHVSAWSGACYLTPLVGAWYADGIAGRYRTIFLFSLIYIVGLVQLAAGTLLQPPSRVMSLMALYIIALGTGGIKPCISAFGAEQFGDAPEEEARKQSFFHFFYGVINVGALFATLVIVPLQEHTSWTVGYALPTLCMAASLCVFRSGRSIYRQTPPQGSALTRAGRVLASAGWRTLRARLQALGCCGGGGGRSGGREAPAHWLLRASAAHGGSFPAHQVAEVMQVWRLRGVFLSCVLFWAIYNQMNGTFINQGRQMDCRLGGGGVSVPAATISTANILAVLGFIPVADRLLPRLGWSRLFRIGAGMGVVGVAMLAAALVEWWRRSLAAAGATFEVREHKVTLEAARLSVLWQVPQYALIGVGEVLASVGTLELFYAESPPSMRSVCMALQLLSASIGAYSSALLVQLVDACTRARPWITENLNHGHLDRFFLLLALLMVANLLLFGRVCRAFNDRTVADAAGSAADPQKAARDTRL